MAVKNTVDFEAAINRRLDRLYARLEGFAARAEQQAKEERPWTDQTVDARNGLRGEAFRDESEMGVRLMHTMEYGLYLETANDGKYAILKPTLDAVFPDIKAAAIEEFGGAG